MTTQTRYENIVLDDKGVPLIGGTSTKVIELVLEYRAYGWSPEEIHFQHPTLSLGQIHSAFAYYWDHREALDRDIEERQDKADQLEEDVKPSPLQSRLQGR